MLCVAYGGGVNWYTGRHDRWQGNVMAAIGTMIGLQHLGTVGCVSLCWLCSWSVLNSRALAGTGQRLRSSRSL